MKILTWLVRIALFLLVISFAVRNTDLVLIRWIPGFEIELPVILALLAAFMFGLLAAWLILLPSWLKAKRSSSQASKALARAEKDRANKPVTQEPEIASSPALTVGPTHGI